MFGDSKLRANDRMGALVEAPNLNHQSEPFTP
ncbi:hypothetical protein MicloDRAFT_00034070 [Microvirga lotononidis]|uniref:Uncharacterized protein n=1 Tax=Microvirga lotononidis TaxID=864069 RepID=I4YSB4_9HYPH|nr:hypothetical protein MicloDRAFT_00034070 [Microvirga lotononidis]